jgi:hypothetical protein
MTGYEGICDPSGAKIRGGMPSGEKDAAHMGYAEPESSGAIKDFPRASSPTWWEADPMDYNKVRR